MIKIILYSILFLISLSSQALSCNGMMCQSFAPRAEITRVQHKEIPPRVIKKLQKEHQGRIIHSAPIPKTNLIKVKILKANKHIIFVTLDKDTQKIVSIKQ